jgi:hypothetical protein
VDLDPRISFIERWYRRALADQQDTFDRFFAMWICVVAAAARFCSETGRRRNAYGDRAEIAEYFVAHPGAVREALESRLSETLWLANRRGPSGGAVVDVVGLNDRHPERREQWRQHWLEEVTLEPADAAALFAHVAHDIRNNVFHGQKLYDDVADRKVVEHLWPLLAAIVDRIELAGANAAQQPQWVPDEG